MKKRDLLKYSLVMALCSVLALEAVSYALMGGSIVRMPSLWGQEPRITVHNDLRCADAPPIAGLGSVEDPHLRKLDEYQRLCQSVVTNHLMVFTGMPESSADAKTSAGKMVASLKEYQKYNITPIVIAEPTTAAGKNINFADIKAGKYNQWFDEYFAALKAGGLTDKDLGIWTPFPEANLPYWEFGATKPEDFGILVTTYLTIAKKHFPHMRASVLLNSATYSADDFDWARGEYLSLHQYVKHIKPGLVNSFGLQGFPWSPPANRGGASIFDAAEFLNGKLAKEAANHLGTKNIWLNTGTFRAKYVGDTVREAHVSPEKRIDILNGIAAQAKALKKDGYTVSVNIFAQNKGETQEGTDWSYFTSDTIRTSPASPVFVNFAGNLKGEGIELWLFDK